MKIDCIIPDKGVIAFNDADTGCRLPSRIVQQYILPAVESFVQSLLLTRQGELIMGWSPEVGVVILDDKGEIISCDSRRQWRNQSA